MARHLQLPHDLNSDQPRALVPQWMTDHHDSSNINSVLVEKGSVKRPSDDTGGQRHDKSTWRSEDRPSDKMWGADKHSTKPWGAEKHSEKIWGAADQFHHPQPDRFAPQGPRNTRPGHQEFAPPSKGNDRWRDDGQVRRNNAGHHAESLVPWGSPQKGVISDQSAPNENWNRSGQVHGNYQRPSPNQLSHRADNARWGTGPGKWDSEDHHTPQRPTPWDAPKVGGFDQGSKDASRNGVARSFVQYSRPKPAGREPPIGASANRWTPSMAQNQPHTVNDGPQNSAPQEVPSKLGGGPQKYKYTIEQLLSIYADLSEKKMLVLKDLELNHVEELPAAETEASLLKIVNDIAQQMVEEGFATKAERRLASRLNALVEASQPKETECGVQDVGDSELLAPANIAGSGISTGREESHEEANRASFLDGLVGAQSPFSTPKFQDHDANQHARETNQNLDTHTQQHPAFQSHQSHGPGGPQLNGPSHDAQLGGQYLGTSHGASQTGPSSNVQQIHNLLRNANEWYYKDPKGDIQGPYSQEAIETWHDSGFFPPDLPLSTSRESPQWHPLNQLLVIWRSPPQNQAQNLINVDSFLPHQASGQVPHLQAQSAASRMLDNAETGVFSQSSSGLTGQTFNAQSAPGDQQRFNPHDLLGGQASQASFQTDRSSNLPFFSQQPGIKQSGLQMSNPLPHHLSNNQMGLTGMQDSLTQHLLGSQSSQQMGQRLGQGVSQQGGSFLGHQQGHFGSQFPQQAEQGVDSGSRGMSSLETQLQSLGLHGSRQLDGPQYNNNLASSRAPGALGLELLNRLQGHSRPQQPPADPIVELLGSITRDSHGSSQNIAPIGPHTSQQQQQKHRLNIDQPGGLRLDDWLGAQSGGLSNLPSQDLHSNHSGYSAGLGRESLIEPSQALHHESARPALLNSSRASSELRPDVDQIVQPKPQPSVAAVGPPSRKIGPPAPARLADPVSRPEEHAPEEVQGAPFQKVQKAQKRKEQPSELPSAPPQQALKPPPPRPSFEQKPQPEAQKRPTLGEAAGLTTHQQEPSEPAPAPWAGQQPKGPRQKTLLEIQREEAEQARVRAEQEAAEAAARASQNTQASVHSSWARPLSKPSSVPVTSFAEIQEQESRQKVVQPPPPPPAANLHPQWSTSSGQDGKPNLAARLSQSLSSGEKKPTRVQNPRPTSKPSPQPSQDEDELFWDPQPSSLVSKGSSTELGRNGSLGIPNQKLGSVAEVSGPTRDTSEAENSLSPEFADWCRSKLRELRNGDDDLNLILFLMTVGSNAEIAEYMTQFFGRTSAVAAFSNEFIKRKLVEQSGRKKGKSKKPSQPAPTNSASNIGVAPLSSNATGWSKLPKKKKKGQKMDTTMLGFGTGTNYAALEKLEG